MSDKEQELAEIDDLWAAGTIDSDEWQRRRDALLGSGSDDGGMGVADADALAIAAMEAAASTRATSSDEQRWDRSDETPYAYADFEACYGAEDAAEEWARSPIFVEGESFGDALRKKQEASGEALRWDADGKAYTRAEFDACYGSDGEDKWQAAPRFVAGKSYADAIALCSVQKVDQAAAVAHVRNWLRLRANAEIGEAKKIRVKLNVLCGYPLPDGRAMEMEAQPNKVRPARPSSLVPTASSSTPDPAAPAAPRRRRDASGSGTRQGQDPTRKLTIAQLEKFYEKHAPEKIGRVEEMLEKYKERVILKKLGKKYGKEAVAEMLSWAGDGDAG